MSQQLYYIAFFMIALITIDWLAGKQAVFYILLLTLFGALLYNYKQITKLVQPTDKPKKPLS